MHRGWNDKAAIGRAHWLGALAEALAEAERLTARLVQARVGGLDAVALRMQVQVVRGQVDLLQRAIETAPYLPDADLLRDMIKVPPSPDHVP